MLLHDHWNLGTFMVGYLIGFLFIFAMRRFFPTPFYAKRTWAILKLLWLFIVELVISTFVVIRQVLRPRLDIRPGIFKVRTSLTNEWEIALLSTLSTLTPGPVGMEVAPEGGPMDVPSRGGREVRSRIM